MGRRLGLFLALVFAAPLLAQRSNDAEAAAGCALCSAILLVPVVIVVVNIILFAWVARDATARGMEPAILWMLLVMVTSLPGLVIYLLARPKGQVVRCLNCRNRRLETSTKCPHCGSA